MQDCGYTSEWTGPTVERVLSNGKRVWALSFRRWMVGQARKPGTSLAGLAMRHGVNANLLRHWMAVEAAPQPTSPPLPPLLPVALEAPMTIASQAAKRSCAIEVTLPARRRLCYAANVGL